VAKEPGKYPCGRCGCTPEGRDQDGGRWKIFGGDPTAPEIVSEICPRRLLTHRTLEFMRLYGHYKRGVLPVAGGLLDQPAAYCDAMATLEQWLTDG